MSEDQEDQVSIDQVPEDQVGISEVQDGDVQTDETRHEGSQNGAAQNYLSDGRPVIGPGIERFTPEGHHKALVDVVWIAIFFAGLVGLLALIILIFGGIRLKRAWFTMKDMPLFIGLGLVLFVCFALQDLISLRPNSRYFYYDADKLAKAYGLEGIVMGKVKIKRDGDVKIKYYRNRTTQEGLQLGLTDIKVRKDCLPISYPVIVEWIDRYGQVKMSACGLDVTSQGVSLNLDSLGSFPCRAKRSYMLQTAGNELVLKG
ncbi:hypothetical protein PT279_01190 [Bifidobacterium sp. ESL0784]|uniref:hypothetical protein n=1 Tax=Bifidobacterium sp. ESL0784 TaxID=2983231 RepID=UPI0023F9DD09|nr:hypothetical protein [Bifidobacterium sp. ESL0784]MDF7640213.1 hypothetical protein [Bifidobacterium sp. ESL0784]